MVGRIRDWLLYVYDVHYRKLLLFPLAIIIASIAVISYNYAVTGELFEKDVSLKGGITVTVFSGKDIDADKLQSDLASDLQRDVSVRILSQAGSSVGFIVEAEGSEKDASGVLEALQSRIGQLDKKDYNVQVIGSSLSESFLREALFSLIFAFVLMGIAVIVYFRALIPSLFVISAAFSDILSTFAVIVLLNERLSTAGLAAFLMLIGYSVDTDILLTTRVLKGKEGTVFQRTVGAMKTGLFMTLTALAATTIGLVFSQSETIRQIMLVLSVGLVFDMIHTWFTNAGVLRWYLERKKVSA
ncbi:MMPL family transporter [Candidatus Woesearchaeota archaeon]|nr:MMPL family transporter [Candidatus Woesearchaeota archaeon]